MADYQRKFPIHGNTPASTHLELCLRDNFDEILKAFGPSSSDGAKVVLSRAADITAAVHSVLLELESRINRLEDELRNR